MYLRPHFSAGYKMNDDEIMKKACIAEDQTYDRNCIVSTFFSLSCSRRSITIVDYEPYACAPVLCPNSVNPDGFLRCLSYATRTWSHRLIYVSFVIVCCKQIASEY